MVREDIDVWYNPANNIAIVSSEVVRMYAIEFHTTVKNGIIQIPFEYQTRFQHRVKVILLAAEEAQPTANLIDQLLAKPLRIKNFKPLSREEIYVR